MLETGLFSGVYSSSPDGTGNLTLNLGFGFTLIFSMVITDRGQGLQLVGTGCDGCGAPGTDGSGFSGVARAAQAAPLKGSYGFKLNSSPFPGEAFGVMNFDGAGNVTASVTTVPSADPKAQISKGTLTGTDSVNADGSGTINLARESGQAVSSTYAMVVTDGGSGLLLLQTAGAPDVNGVAGGNVPFGIARLQ